MSVHSFLSKPLFGRDTTAQSKSAVEADGDTAAEAGPPFDGYDGLDDREVMEGLSDHSQTELEAVESYERDHKDRVSVMDKVRYMRGSEPLPGYDALSVKEIVAALEKADVDTIKAVRSYERKFANRPDVLEEVVRVHKRCREHPASEAPSHQRADSSAVSIPTGLDSNHALSG